MTRHLLKSCRSGNWNEELGILLLRSVAAVAAVPRPDDVGLDAIATLLRPAGDLLVAENSFYVQIKTLSEKPSKNVIDYVGSQVRWLEQLELPFFVGLVNKKKSMISLNPGHRLSEHFIQRQYTRVRLVLAQSRRKTLPKSGEAHVCLGPPLLEWSTANVVDDRFGENEYRVLKAYLEAEQRNIIFRPVPYFQPITWKTGEVPECGRGFITVHSLKSPEELKVAFRYLTPSLHVLATRARNGDGVAMAAVKAVIAYMRDNGCDPDPGDRLTMSWDEYLKTCKGEAHA